jgi:hypothetical protein
METISVVGIFMSGGLSTLCVYFFRRPRQDEIRAVYEISKNIHRKTSDALELIKCLRDRGISNHYINQMHRSIDNCLELHKGLFNERVDAQVDRKFFISAVKGALPKESWRKEFHLYAMQTEREIFQSESIKEDLKEISNKTYEILRSRCDAELDKVDPSGSNIESEIHHSPLSVRRLKRFLCQNKDLRTLVKKGFLKDASRGASCLQEEYCRF